MRLSALRPSERTAWLLGESEAIIQQAPHIAKAMNALDHSSGLWKRDALINRRMWRNRNQIRNIAPSKVAAQRSIHLTAMLSPAAIKAARP